MSGNVHEQFSAIALVKAYTAEERESKRFSADNEAQLRNIVRQGHPGPLVRDKTVTIEQTVGGLSKLRSGLSKSEDSNDAWQRQTGHFFKHVSAREFLSDMGKPVAERVRDVLDGLKAKKSSPEGRGARFVKSNVKARANRDWIESDRLGGICNHETRGHIVPDLYRYLYAICFADAHGRSP